MHKLESRSLVDKQKSDFQYLIHKPVDVLLEDRSNSFTLPGPQKLRSRLLYDRWYENDVFILLWSFRIAFHSLISCCTPLYEYRFRVFAKEA